MSTEVDDFLEHVGVKGMKWGVKRGADGVRPIARSLDNSAFGTLAKKNVDRHNARASGRSAKQNAPKADKKPSSGKQKDMDIKAARQRLQAGKNFGQKLLNADSFGKPLGGRTMLSLMNKGNSPEDVALASRMTRGQKALLAGVVGASVLLNVVARK